MIERLVSFVGYFVMLLLAWSLSRGKTRFPWRVVISGTILQFILAVFILHTAPGRQIFQAIGTSFRWVADLTDYGSAFVFGEKFGDFPFAFKVLPTIVFFSSLASVLYFLGIMQKVVWLMAVVMEKVMGVSGAESLSASANIFLGQTEAPLLIKPYIAGMTKSELNAVMIGGFANISGSLIAAFSSKTFGMDAGHLVTASVVSAPASLLVAKIMLPEREHPATLGRTDFSTPPQGENVFEAAAIGAADGAKLAINVAAMLIAFIALLAMLDSVVSGAGMWVSELTGLPGPRGWTLSGGLGYLFAPLAWMMGIELGDCLHAGELLGKKMFANEFVAYVELAKWNSNASDIKVSDRTVRIMTYALCGFANFASIGVQIGGIGAMAPDRQPDIARLAFRAMLGGTLVNLMLGCIAGILT